MKHRSTRFSTPACLVDCLVKLKQKICWLTSTALYKQLERWGRRMRKGLWKKWITYVFQMTGRALPSFFHTACIQGVYFCGPAKRPVLDPFWKLLQRNKATSGFSCTPHGTCEARRLFRHLRRTGEYLARRAPRRSSGYQSFSHLFHPKPGSSKRGAYSTHIRGLSLSSPYRFCGNKFRYGRSLVTLVTRTLPCFGVWTQKSFNSPSSTTGRRMGTLCNIWCRILIHPGCPWYSTPLPIT